MKNKIKNQKYKLKAKFKKDLKYTPLINELISCGAFIGDYYKWTHFSQKPYIYGIRNNYSFYNIQYSIKLLTNATRFLKNASKKKKLQFIFVGNPEGAEKESSLIFSSMSKKFFPNDNWHPGFFSKRPVCDNYVLVIYDINSNILAFQEAVNACIPVVAFVTPSCDIRGVDYPIILNLKNNKLWYANFCKALFQNDTQF